MAGNWLRRELLLAEVKGVQMKYMVVKLLPALIW